MTIKSDSELCMKVYIVTQGSYSDYHIDRVFSTIEKAQEYLDHIGNDNDAEVEEYNIDEETPRGVFAYRVIIYDYPDKDTEVRLWSSSEFYKDTFHYHTYKGKKSYQFDIETTGAPHAIKIASERLMQIKAMPYLFPRMKDECVWKRDGLGIVRKRTPRYNYFTRDIVLGDRKYIEP